MAPASMIQAMPRHWFSWNYDLFLDGVSIGEIDLAWFQVRASLKTLDGEFVVRRESRSQRRYSLSLDGQVLAVARQTNLFFRAYDVTVGGRLLQLKAISFFKRDFGLFDAGDQIGRIFPTGIMSNRAVIDLPNEVPIQLQLFLFWLVVVQWRKPFHRNE